MVCGKASHALLWLSRMSPERVGNIGSFLASTITMASTVMRNGINRFQWQRPFREMASTVSNGNDRSEKWYRPFQMATTVYEREICYGDFRSQSRPAAIYWMEKSFRYRALIFWKSLDIRRFFLLLAFVKNSRKHFLRPRSPFEMRICNKARMHSQFFSFLSFFHDH